MQGKSFSVDAALRVISLLYRWLITLRNFMYDYHLFKVYKSRLPVICVGNLTAGGNGKTPLVLFLAQVFIEKGYTPVILSRGYGGRMKVPTTINENMKCSDVGDEPMMLFRAVKEKLTSASVVVARKRALGLRYIEEQKSGNIVILDDGFQHRRIKADHYVISINISTENDVVAFQKGHLLPSGRFREPKQQAFKRMRSQKDCFVAVKRGGESGTEKTDTAQERNPVGNFHHMLEIPQDFKIFSSVFSGFYVTSFNGTQEPFYKHKPLNSEISTSKVIAFSAIANPEGFYNGLESLGFSILEKFTFKDHTYFQESDFTSIIRGYYKGEASDPFLVVTEKDAVKINELPLRFREAEKYFFDRIYILRYRYNLIEKDEFLAFLNQK
jgi:tetraacyldisaccharide 4'-kinase